MGWALRTGWITLLATAVAGADQASPVDDAWVAVRELRFAEALRIARADTSAEARLAEATALVQTQPVTRENLALAERLLRELIAGQPAGSELAVGARYQLARLLQLNPFGADLPAAVEQFGQLINEAPHHPLAQAAVVKLAIIELYSASDETARADLFARYEGRVESLSDPMARRDMHMTLAGVASRYGMPVKTALKHLQSVDLSTVAKDRSVADLLVRRGETALAAGDSADARWAFETFLSRFPADQRSYYIRQQLQSLPAGGGGR